MTTLSIRIDNILKKKAGKTLSAMGLDLSGGVKIFLNQVVIEQGLPFTPTKNPSAIRAKWDAEVSKALKHGKTYKTGKEALADLW